MYFIMRAIFGCDEPAWLFKPFKWDLDKVKGCSRLFVDRVSISRPFASLEEIC